MFAERITWINACKTEQATEKQSIYLAGNIIITHKAGSGTILGKTILRLVFLPPTIILLKCQRSFHLSPSNIQIYYLDVSEEK